MAENLRFLQDLGRRSHAGGGLELSRSSRRAWSRPAWLRALMALATVQAALGLLGYLFGRPDASAIPAGLLAATAAVLASAATVLVLLAAQDRRAWLLAALFCTLASASSQRLLSWLAGEVPAWALSLASALLPETFLPLFLWLFVRDFPRVVHLSKLAGALRHGIRLSVVFGSVLMLANALDRGLPGLAAPALPDLLRRDAAGSLYWALVVALAAPAVVAMVLRSREAPSQERRRVGLFLVGLAAGVAPLLTLVGLEWLVPAVDRFTDQPGAQFYGAFAIYLPLLSIPVSTSYAVLAHRILDLRLILGRAFRLALARWSLDLVIALPLALALARLYRHRHLSLGAALDAALGPVLLTALALGVALRAGRRTLLSRVAGRLGLGGGDPRVSLAACTADLRGARAPQEVVEALRQHLPDALGAESVVMLLDHGPATTLTPVLPGPRPLARESALVSLAATDPGPLSLDPLDPSSLLPLLPEADQQWVIDGNIALLLPLQAPDGRLTGLLGLSPRANEAPYTSEDRLLASAFAASAMLTLQACEGPGQAGRESGDQPAGECGRCRRLWPSVGQACSCGTVTSMAALPHVLGGKFRVDSVLGRGGMGVVYRGTDLALDRDVALKTLPRVGAQGLARLRREARSMASFIHPHLALIFGAESWRGVPVLVVEYLAGGTLAARLGEPWPVQAALELGSQLAAGLEAMHAKGLLHRDVKPTNIGFSAEGVPKLLDFGLARLVEEARGVGETSVLEGGPPPADVAPAEASRITSSCHVVGTPLYLSPECLRGQPPGPAQDLWALHLVLWEALAGRHPFRQSGHGDWRKALLRPAPALSDVRADCAGPVSDLLAEGLHPRSERRPSSARELRSRLVALAGGQADVRFRSPARWGPSGGKHT